MEISRINRCICIRNGGREGGRELGGRDENGMIRVSNYLES